MITYFYMLVEVLQPRGYCAGVNNAIKIALTAKEEHPDKEVYVLGMLVHNDFVVSSLEKKGIHTAANINEIPNGEVIIFTAHGHDQKLDNIAEEKQLIIYDAICPKVRSNHLLILKELKDNHQVIFIGLSGHPETIGAISVDTNVLLYDVKQGFDYSLLKDESPLVINQTTLNILELKNIHQEILAHVPRARITDEICSSTRRRQEVIKEIQDDVDLIIVVGDQKSSNSNRLLEVARLSHPAILSLMISDAAQLDESLLKNKKHIVISSGASTPDEIIDAIVNKIKSLN